ncbi:MAG: Trm112 family protein [Candidatus Hermodarchaeota archaeon]
MKPWLFDILACPIDKHFPLKLYIFSFETNSNDFNSFLEILKNRNLEFIKDEEIIEISQEGGIYFIKDNIIIKKTELETYINLIILSINELDNIFNKSQNKVSKNCFEIISTKIKTKILNYKENFDPNTLDQIIPELYFLNKIKLETEIESGLLFCTKCNRWYPIIETIPQMLPDEYRNEKKEIEFLQTIKNLLDEEFFNQDLKPFNLKKTHSPVV